MIQLRPTFSESWYRVADLKPRLRATAQVSRQYYRGERWYVVRDPAANQYHRLSDPAYRFIALLDGDRTVADAWDLVGGQMADDAPTQPEVIQILSQLYAANLIETNISPDATVLLRRHKKQAGQKAKGRLMNLLFPRIPLFDPDRFLKLWMPLVGPMLSWVGAVIWLLVVGAACVMVVPQWDALAQAGKDTINFSANPENLFYLYGSFVVIKLIHELGHGFTCRRFGGEVHELGVMFLVLFPAPYVDASSAWAFPNKWARILVGAGGMIFELFVAAIAAFVWLATYGSSDTFLPQLAYNVMLIASVSTVVFNINPLLRYDGYYMLSDWLEIPNLQYRSNEYAMGLVKRHLFRVKSPHPLPPPAQRVWLFFYSILSTCYRTFVGLAIMIMVLYQLPEEVKIIGMIMGAGAIATFFIVPVYKLLKYLTTDPELHRKRTRAWAYTLATTAGVVALVGMIQFPVRVRAEGVVRPLDRAPVYVQGAGFVEEVRKQDGDQVGAGEVLLVLRNEPLDAEVVQHKLNIERVKVKIAAAALANPGLAQGFKEEQTALERQLAEAQRRQGLLRVTAPKAGRLVAPDLHLALGTWLQQGSRPVGEVYAAERLVGYAMLDQRDAELVSRSQGKFEAKARLVGDLRERAVENPKLIDRAVLEVVDQALTIAGGGTLQNDPSDPTGRRVIDAPFEFQFELPNTLESVVPGQRTYVRITMNEPETLLVQGYRKVKQLIQTTRV